MLKYIIPFFLVTLFLPACKHGKPQPEIINHDKMISLLTDLHIVDGGMYNVVSFNTDSTYKYGTGRYLALFKRYHVDSTTFRRSLKYYTGKPVELEAMYDEILKNLTAKTDSANKSMLKMNNGRRPNTE
jgi:hypothetical protein